MFTERKNKILYKIVTNYIRTKQPVGSKLLSDSFEERISPATIRNEMSELEDMGYLTHPHTSAGRVPTEMGYRYYVDNYVGARFLSVEEAEFIKNELRDNIVRVDMFMEKTAKIVSSLTNEACLAFVLPPTFFYFREVNFVKINTSDLLAVLISKNGFVLNTIVNVGEEISNDMLKKITNFLNAELYGVRLDFMEREILSKIESSRSSLYAIYHFAKDIILDAMNKSMAKNMVFLGGSERILEKPEFCDLDKTRRIFKIFENKENLARILMDDMDKSSKLNVKIGRENRCCDLWDCSVVSISCGDSYDMGALSVVGPMSLNYEDVFSVLSYISGIVEENCAKIRLI